MNESQREIVDCMEEAAKSLVLLLNELLDISVIDSGHAEIQREPLCLVDLVRNLVPLFRGESERKNISLSFESEPEVPLSSIDRQQMRRLIDNLITNAIKFTPSGGKVLVRVRQAAPDVCLEVLDTGPGIPEKEAGRLFKEFGKTSNLPTGGESSTGLGLSICQRIVQAHDGKITFQNLPEGGTRFRVILPAIES